MTDKPTIIPEADEQQDGAFMRGFKAAKRQGVCDYDRGVIAGLCQAREICSGREDMLAERIASEIQDAIESTGRASVQVAQPATHQRKLVPLLEHNKLTAGPAAWTDQRVPIDVFQTARAVFGTSSHEDDQRVIAFAKAVLAAKVSPDAALALKTAREALKEAELLLHKAWAEHGLRTIDDGNGTLVDVVRAADRMDAAIDAVDAAMAMPANARAAFESWAPSVHMSTARWAVNPELYDDENAISAWQGWEAGVAWAVGAQPAAA